VIMCVDSKFMKAKDRLFLPHKLANETKQHLTHGNAQIRLEVAKLLNVK